MNKDSQHYWKKVNDMLLHSGQQVNILEEEVDLIVQKEYFELTNTLLKNTHTYHKLSTKFFENINDLFDSHVSDDVKKNMLVILATMDNIAVYRAIESFYKTDTGLKKWAVIALQQSRILILSSLLDEPGLYISSGLGGRGNLLRYFCVFSNSVNDKLQKFQQGIVKNETEQALKQVKGELEKISFNKGYSTLILLLPIDTDLKPFFEALIKECNTFGNFLHENMIVTNVKKLSRKEITDLFKQGQESIPPSF